MMRVHDVSFRYGDRPVLSDVSFEVTPGETLAVMGANGSGKTTLLRLLAGLREPHAGTVEADGVVGFAPEDPRAGLFASTVAEEVAFFPGNRGLDADREAAAAMRALAVDDLADRNPLSLSFGEQRRVAVAAVLAGDPTVLALDEPTGGLDRGGERQLGELLSGLAAAVVLSTHEADFAWQYADRVAVLADAGIRRVGPARDVLTDGDLLRDAGVRPPGVVTWAARRGCDRVPEDLADAAAMAGGRR